MISDNDYEDRPIRRWRRGGDEPDCITCAGDGIVGGDEMDDPLWYDETKFYTCPNCRGTGLRKDQSYW